METNIKINIPRCLSCNIRSAIKVEPFGYLYCKVCQKKYRKLDKPKQTIEVVTDAIKEDRKIFKKDITQPFRQGELSKEFVEANPEQVKKMVEEGHVTKEEIKNAKNVWTESEYYRKD
jgi:hypothetical protein